MTDFSGIEAKLRAVFGDVQGKAKKILAIEAEKSIQRNFDAKGRPAWTPPAPHNLVIRGALRNVRAVEFDGGIYLTVDARSRAYARIQNEGGVINMPARKIKFRKIKISDKKYRTVFASSKHKRITKVTEARAYKIKIPARPFLRIPQEDYAGIINAIKEGIKL